MIDDAKFWDNAAEKYARDPIKDMDAYTYTLERTRSHLKPGDTVLEIGCGTGSTALLLAESVETYHGTDISDEMIKIARRKVAQTNLSNLSFETHTALNGIHAHEALDAVFAFNLMHLVRDADATLEAIHSALRPGGLFISKTVCMKSSSFKFRLLMKIIPIAQALGKAPFVHDWTTRQWDKMVEAAGFEIIESGNHPVNPPARYVVARKK